MKDETFNAKYGSVLTIPLDNETDSFNQDPLIYNLDEESVDLAENNTNENGNSNDDLYNLNPYDTTADNLVHEYDSDDVPPLVEPGEEFTVDQFTAMIQNVLGMMSVYHSGGYSGLIHSMDHLNAVGSIPSDEEYFTDDHLDDGQEIEQNANQFNYNLDESLMD
jgi:hypothetical protein